MRKCNCCLQYKEEEELVSTASSRRWLAHKCKTCENLYRKQLLRNVRTEVLTHYSTGAVPQCECCGETRYEFLTINHLNGNGNAHRKINGRNSIMMFRWLKFSGYPDGFNVLCYNCNIASHFYGTCPHTWSKS